MQRSRDVDNGIKWAAQQRAHAAIISGRLIRPDHCSRCGAAEIKTALRTGYLRSSIEAHHPDYRKPLKVIWLCSTCHRAEHKRQLRLGNSKSAKRLREQDRIKAEGYPREHCEAMLALWRARAEKAERLGKYRVAEGHRGNCQLWEERLAESNADIYGGAAK